MRGLGRLLAVGISLVLASYPTYLLQYSIRTEPPKGSMLTENWLPLMHARALGAGKNLGNRGPTMSVQAPTTIVQDRQAIIQHRHHALVRLRGDCKPETAAALMDVVLKANALLNLRPYALGSTH